MTIDGTVWTVRLIGLAMIALGVYVSWNAWFAFASRRWPSVSGRLLFAGVYGYDGVPPGFRASVRYQYSVGGITYESTRVRFGGVNPFSHHMVASELSGIGQSSGSVQVFYDPRHPRRACLVTGANEWTLLLPIVLLSVGVGIAFLSFSELGS